MSTLPLCLPRRFVAFVAAVCLKCSGCRVSLTFVQTSA